MRIYHLAAVATAIVILAGCSGRVQTNPVPEEVTIHIPTKVRHVAPDVNVTALEEEFDRYVARVMATDRPQPDDIFTIGYQRKDNQ